MLSDPSSEQQEQSADEVFNVLKTRYPRRGGDLDKLGEKFWALYSIRAEKPMLGSMSRETAHSVNRDEEQLKRDMERFFYRVVR